MAVASEAFAAGEDFFEDYRQPNYVYFLYHGFVLSNHGAADASNSVCVLARPCTAPLLTVGAPAPLPAALNISWHPTCAACCDTRKK